MHFYLVGLALFLCENAFSCLERWLSHTERKFNFFGTKSCFFFLPGEKLSSLLKKLLFVAGENRFLVSEEKPSFLVTVISDSA